MPHTFKESHDAVKRNYEAMNVTRSGAPAGANAGDVGGLSQVNKVDDGAGGSGEGNSAAAVVAAVATGASSGQKRGNVSFSSGQSMLSEKSGDSPPQTRLVGRQNSFREEPPMGVASLKELAMDSVQEGVTIADFSLPDQPLIYANHGFELITGYSIEETIGHNCRFLQGPNTEPEKLVHIRQSINAGLSCTVQLKNYRKNGTEFINHLSLTPIRTAGGRVTHYVGIQSDVTELTNTREAELDALKKATIAEAATDAKSKFLAHMSHEIRTPLNGLIAVGQLLEDTSLNRMQRDYVTTIRSSGETLQALISDILDFSRVEADKLVLRKEPFYPQAVIATVMEIVGLHSSRLKLNIGYHLDDGVPEVVVGDSMRVQQVLLNTLNNAIKFTEKGDIMIRLYLGKPGEAEAAANRATEAAIKLADEEMTEGIKSNPADRNWREEATKRGMNKYAKKLAAMDWLQKSGNAAASGKGGGEGGGREEGPGSSSEGCTHSQSHSHSHSGQAASTSACGENDEGNDGKNDDGWVLHFYVKDTGIGLDSTNIKTIFDSFQQVDLSPTRKYDGTGLGLAISQRLCEAMGGRMWAESPGLGMGSTFHFSIRCDEVPGARKAHEAGEASGGAGVLRGGGVASGAVGDEDKHPMMVPGGARADPIEAEKEAVARRKMRACGADTTTFKSMVRTPSAMNFESICKGQELRVLLYDESGMVRQTLKAAMMRWGLIVTAVANADDMVKALNEGVPASPGIKGGPYSLFVAEKNNAFVKAIRRWTSAHGKLVSKSSPAPEAGGDAGGVAGEGGGVDGGDVDRDSCEDGYGEKAAAATGGGGSEAVSGMAFHCPVFILMTWPSYSSSSDDINDIGSWGDIGALNRCSFNSEASPSGSGGTGGSAEAGGPTEYDEEVEDFLSSCDSEILPKPVQHARLQKLLASSVADLFSSGETRYRASKKGDKNGKGKAKDLEEHEEQERQRQHGKTTAEPASSADRDHDRDHVNLPAGAPSAAGGGGAAVSNFTPLLPKNMRILLAEDHHINMKVACAVLARCGHKDITIAKDGVEVLEKLAVLPSGLDSFDIVLMDLHMPRMGGMECVRQMRLLYPHSKVPIVAVTADVVEESRDRCMSNGFNAWISKPFRIEQLGGLLDEFVPGSGAGTGKAGGG